MLLRKLWMQIKDFKPPLVLCCILATLFSAAALLCVTADFGKSIAPAILYLVYVFAAIFLSLAVWAIVLFCHRSSPRHHFLALAHRNALTARMVNDFSYRTVLFTYASFVLNILFALAKGVAGWAFASWWFISLSAYYLALCISKLMLLRVSRRLDKLENQSLREQKEWKAGVVQ